MAQATEDGLWLDLTGTTHLFGGEETFCRQVTRFLARLGYIARIAIADTPGAAHAVARFGNVTVAIVPPGASVQTIACLPIEALRFDGQAVAACRRFGIERVADLLPMPRGSLARATSTVKRSGGFSSSMSDRILARHRAEARRLAPPSRCGRRSTRYMIRTSTRPPFSQGCRPCPMMFR